MKFDAYTLKARILPAILSALPFFVLHFYYLSPMLGHFWGQFLSLKVSSDATLLAAFLFLLVQFSRYLSKELFENRIFADGFNLPTNDYLLHADSHYSPEYTKQVHARIKDDFGIVVPSERRELGDVGRSRQIISEAVSHIRAKVGAGRLTLQHNTEYGFIRNLIGGAVIAIVVCGINIVVFTKVIPNRAATGVSVVLAVFYLLILLSSSKLMKSFGHSYAKILIQEYMTLGAITKRSTGLHRQKS